MEPPMEPPDGLFVQLVLPMKGEHRITQRLSYHNYCRVKHNRFKNKLSKLNICGNGAADSIHRYDRGMRGPNAWWMNERIITTETGQLRPHTIVGAPMIDTESQFESKHYDSPMLVPNTYRCHVAVQPWKDHCPVPLYRSYSLSLWQPLHWCHQMSV